VSCNLAQAASIRVLRFYLLCRYETTKAADAVSALKAALKPLATCKRDDKWQTIDATLLVPGDLVLLAAGAAVPADCIVNEGRIEVDQAALTGESLPVTMYKGDTPKMGSTGARDGVQQGHEGPPLPHHRFAVASSKPAWVALACRAAFCWSCVSALASATTPNLSLRGPPRMQ
jgi:P-type E1-E2 ATPase